MNAHKQTARWLVDNYDVILLPTFETSDLVPCVASGAFVVNLFVVC